MGTKEEGRKRNRSYRLVEVMITDPSRYKRFLDSLKLGATITAASEAIGVSSSATHRAIKEGGRKEATRELKKIKRDVFKAISGARVLTEAEIRIADPKWWLVKGPGKLLGNDWEEDIKQHNDNDKALTLSNSDIIKGLIVLRRSGISIDELIDSDRIHTLSPNYQGMEQDMPHLPLPSPQASRPDAGLCLPLPTTAPPSVHLERTPTPCIVGAGVNGESSTPISKESPIPPTLPKPKTRRVPVYTLKDGTPLGDYDPPNITKVEPLPKNVKDNIKLTSPKDIGVDGYKNVVEIVQNGDGYSENSPSIDKTIEGSHDLVAQSCNMENNTGQSTEDLLKNLELANQRRSERKMIQQMEQEELEELEDSLPDGLRRFLLNEGD